MPFVKLDCGMLDSTIWEDRAAREIFITALLMARPIVLEEPEDELEAFTPKPTGWVVPAGEYGIVTAPGRGIVRRACVEVEAGALALKRLAGPEVDSRTPDFEGRRMVRIADGFVVLNYAKYREKDHTAAARAKRYRENKRHGVTSRNESVTSRSPSASASVFVSGSSEVGGAGGRVLGGASELPPDWAPKFEDFVQGGFSREVFDLALVAFIGHHRAAGTVATDAKFRGKLATWARQDQVKADSNGGSQGRTGPRKAPRQPDSGYQPRPSRFAEGSDE